MNPDARLGRGARFARLVFSLGLGLAGVFPPASAAEESWIPFGASWRWVKGTNTPSTPATAWRLPPFNDSTWATGPMPFSYGATGATNGTRLTDMRNGYTTLFLRRTFVVADPGQVGALRLRQVIDDGFIVWINGREVQRFNVNDGEQPFNAGTPVAIGSTPVEVSTNFVPAAGLLRAGTNLVAVQAFNRNLTSSDFHLDLELAATLVPPGPPTVLAVDPAPGATVGGLSTLTVTFSKPVTGVDAADLLLNGVPAVGLSAAEAATRFTFAVTPPAPGPVQVTWGAEHQIQSLAGEPFDASAPGATWAYTVAPPQVAEVQPPRGATLDALGEITVRFTTPVLGVRAEDLLVNGLPAAALEGEADTWTFRQAPPEPGPVTVSFNANHEIHDLGGNRFAEGDAGASWLYTLRDTAPPTLRQLAPAAGVRVGRLGSVTVLFSEPVRGVDAADLLVNHRPARSVSGTGAGPYEFVFEALAPGTVQFAWTPGHDIRDLAEPANAFAGEGWTLTLDPPAGGATVRLNEVVAANRNGLRDEEDEPQDWIELYNPGPATVDLRGWSLTDDPAQPGRWVFPGRTLAPGQYLVVFASGKDRRPAGATAPLHTSFRLDAAGEYLGLFPPDQPPRPADELAPAFPEQRPDVAYGRDAAGAWRYFASPTPGATNRGTSLAEPVPEPHFSVERGWFDEPFTLRLTTAFPGTTLRYTRDGREPTADRGEPYTGPLRIERTTILRAAAFAPGHLPSRVVTHTYLFLDQVIHQPADPPGFPATWGTYASFPGNIVPADYEMDLDPLRADPNNPASPVDPVKLQRLRDGLLELPLLSLVLDPADLFGPTGLYDAANIVNKAFPLQPCSVEMFLPDGRTAFATTAGLEGHGNASREPRKNPKHGFKLNFRGDFGPGRLEFPLFPESPLRRFDDLILRPDFNTSWRHWSDSPNNGNGAYQRSRATRTRDAWIKHTFRDMGRPASHNRYVHLFLNGLYWGTYDLSEQPTAHFAAAWYGGRDEDYDAYDQGQLRAGTAAAYNALLALTNLADHAAYEQMKRLLDVPHHLDYTLLHFFAGHQDWGLNKNWHAIRPRTPDGTFKYFPWDGECVLLNEDVNRVASSDVPSGLHTRLLANAQYRLDFADRAHRHLVAPGRALTPSACIARWLYWSNLLDRPIVAESCRWGDYRRDVHPYSDGTYALYTRESHWLPEHQRMVGSYFVNRTTRVLAQLRDAGLYPPVDAPEFRLEAPDGPLTAGGPVPPGTRLHLRRPGPTGVIYYTTNGTDPRVLYAGTLSAHARAYSGPLTLTATLTLKARVQAGDTWSALHEATFTVAGLGPALAFTEINYHPPGGEAFEFVELQNLGPAPVDLDGFSFAGIEFVFPPGSRLPAGAVWVLANRADPAAFAARYPGVPVAGWFGSNLANGGERLALRDRAGHTVLAVHYDDEAGWPAAPDGTGPTLEIPDPRADPHAPAHWQASPIVYGTPGRPPAPPAEPGPVGLSEVMADNAGSVPDGDARPDWIELHNHGPAEADLGGWSLSDTSDPRRFVFPPGTRLPAGAFLVVWCDSRTQAPGLHTGFALDRQGESVFLYNAATQRVDALSFGLQLPDLTLGRVGGLWQLCHPSPGAPNVPVPVGSPAALRLNEWLAEPLPGESPWLELYNSGNLPVSLEGVHLESGPAHARLRSRSFLAAGGHVRLWLDTEAGPDHLELAWPAGGGRLALRDAATRLLDEIALQPQPAGVAAGRLPDGEATVQAFPVSASPGAPNYLPAWTGPVLNEILVRDAAGDAGWVEVFNPGREDADLSGLGLGVSTTASAPAAAGWRFPAGTRLAAGRFLLVHCNPAQAPSLAPADPLHSGLALEPVGGMVVLFDASGRSVDRVAFGFQIPGQSIGLDGDQAWQLLAFPTPRAANAPPAVLAAPHDLRFNEWMARPPEGSDWFELFNPADRPVALGGLWLTDSPALTRRARHQVPPLSFIGPRRWVVWQAVGTETAAPGAVPFALEGDGESLRLYDARFRLVDAVDFDRQERGVSEGRLPDGGETVSRFPDHPTPGAANVRPDTDSDGDGLPDLWEQAHGLDPRQPDAGADPDGDGTDNRAEFLAGTDPQNAGSVLALTLERTADGDLSLEFLARPGRTYRLEATEALPADVWLPLHTEPATAEERRVSRKVPATAATRFYRLVVLP